MMLRNPRALVMCFAILLAGSPAFAADRPESVYNKTLRATTRVETSAGAGTGWIVDKSKKLLITAEHVVGSAKDVKILFPAYRGAKVISSREFYEEQKPVHGRVLRTDARKDLALIEVDQIPEKAGSLPLASQEPDPGDTVHSVGCPGASTGLWAYSEGKVRVLTDVRWTDDSRKSRSARVIETSVAINPGDSGGPLVNDAGEVIGVNHGVRPDARLVSVSIAVGEIKDFLAKKAMPDHSKEIDDLLRRSGEAERNKDWSAAKDFLRQALKLHRDNAAAFSRLAHIENQQQHYKEALAAAGSALKIDDACSDAFREIGFALWKLGNLDKAEAALVLALKYDNRNWQAFDYLIEVLKDEGNEAMAERVLHAKERLQQLGR